jgi:DNA-binding beta-propeller fold protein YncE
MGNAGGRINRRVSGSVVLVLLAALIVGPAQTTGALAPAPIRTIPTPFISGHAGLYGWGATTLLDGSVLIGDYLNYRVAHYAANGTPLPDFYNNAGFGPNQIQIPYGMGTDPNSGAVYICDTIRGRILKASASGNYIMSWGTRGTGVNKYSYPSRAAVASDGRVFIADTWEHMIVIVRVDDAAGTATELKTFGSFGSGPGQMKQPHGIAFSYGAAGVADDRLFVVDTNNKRIQVFDPNGTFVRSFGSAKTAGGQFVGDLRGIAVDQNNDWVYVVDAAGNKIHKFTTGGQHLLSFGSKGQGDGQFSDGGREITVDGNGNVWVGDMPNFRAQVFSPSGAFIREVPFPAKPPADGGFNAPRGVAVDPDGNIFVTDTYNQRIEKFAPDGTFLLKWGSRGRDQYAFNYPRLLAVDPRDGAVVVADTDNHRIKKYTNDGVFLWQVGGGGAQPLQFRNPHGVDVGPDGRIYVADTRNTRVQVLSPNGNFLYQFGSGPGQFKYLRGIAVDVDGTLWVVDSNRDIVQHFTNDGRYLGKIGTKGLADNQFDNPFGVQADGTYVYVADTSTHKVKVWTDPATGDGTFVMAFGGRGTAAGKFIQPDGLYLGPSGTLYIADEGNDRISEWSV